MRVGLAIWFCLMAVVANGQPLEYKYIGNENLILNGSFEEYNDSTPIGGIFYNAPNHWFDTFGTPDHFVFHSGFQNNEGVLDNVIMPPTLNHNSYVGMVYNTFYVQQNAKWSWNLEFISGELVRELEPGDYEFSGSIFISSFQNFGTNTEDFHPHFAFSLTNDSISFSDSEELYKVLNLNSTRFSPIDNSNGSWTDFSIRISLIGGEKFLVLGISDTLLDIERNQDTIYQSYIFIDNLSLRRIEPIAIDENTAQVFPNPSPDGAFTLEVYGNETARPVFALYDATGRLVQQEFLAAGYQRKAVHYPSLASGMYTWRVEDRNNGNAVMGRGKVVVGR